MPLERKRKTQYVVFRARSILRRTDTTKPRLNGALKGQRVLTHLWPEVSGNPGFSWPGDETVDAIFGHLGQSVYLSPDTPRTLGIMMLWACVCHSCRSRGSRHGSRYSQSGATPRGARRQRRSGAETQPRAPLPPQNPPTAARRRGPGERQLITPKVRNARWEWE